MAFLYGVETKALNQAVKRNINRFPEDFMFKLTKNELEILRSQIVTSNPMERQQNTNWKSQIVTSNLNNNHGSDILMSQNATSKSRIAISGYLKIKSKWPLIIFIAVCNFEGQTIV